MYKSQIEKRPAGTKAQQRTTAEVPTSCQNNAKPNVIGLCQLRFNLLVEMILSTENCCWKRKPFWICCYEFKNCVQPENKTKRKPVSTENSCWKNKTVLILAFTNLKTLSSPKIKTKRKTVSAEIRCKNRCSCVVEQIWLSQFWLNILLCPAA